MEEESPPRLLSPSMFEKAVTIVFWVVVVIFAGYHIIYSTLGKSYHESLQAARNQAKTMGPGKLGSNLDNSKEDFHELGWESYLSTLTRLVSQKYYAQALDTKTNTKTEQNGVSSSLGWPNVEEEYFAKELELLGALLLAFVSSSSIRTTNPGSFLADACGECSVEPYQINSRCARTCSVALHTNKTRLGFECYSCSHWAYSIAEQGVDEFNLLWFMPILRHLSVVASYYLNSLKVLDGEFSNHRVSRIEKETVRSSLHKVFQHEFELAGKTKDLINAGGGGGLGVEISCNGSLLLSFGGGGGSGMNVNQATHSFTLGGGLGSGIQFYAYPSSKLIASHGAGGGGGTAQEEAIYPKKIHSIKDLDLSFGFSTDPDDSIFNASVLEKVLHTHSVIRKCWKQENLSIRGSGGAGAGLLGNHGDKQELYQSSFWFRSKSFSKPCKPSCWDGSLKPLSKKPAGKSVSCNYEDIAKSMSDCAAQCFRSSYKSCMCPCTYSSFRKIGCTWASNIRCNHA